MNPWTWLALSGAYFCVLAHTKGDTGSAGALIALVWLVAWVLR